jgi:hypothetical protein
MTIKRPRRGSTRRNLVGGAASATILAVNKPSAPAASVPDADTEIVALVDKIIASYRECNRLEIEAETESSDRAAQIWKQIRDRVDQEWNMRAQLASLRATTLAGFRAKAAVIREFNNCADGYVTGYEDDALAWSLANDLLGL